jgi:hypothetical protein
VRQKLQKVSQERDYYKSFAECAPSNDSRVLQSKLKTLIDFSDELVHADKVNLNESR